MRAFVTLLLILATGILGSTVAHKSDGMRFSELDRMNKIQALSQAVRYEIVSDIPTAMKTLNRLKCRINGGPNADNDVIESLKIFVNSNTALRNKTQRLLHAIENDLQSDLDIAIKTICQWGTGTISLTRTFTDSLKRCLTPAERNSIDLINNVSNAVVQYVCKNEGRRISEYFAADGDKCFSLSLPRIRNCEDTAFSGNFSITEVTDSPVTPPWSIPIMKPNTQVCREFEEHQRCMVAVLRECKDPLPSYEINSLFNIVMKSSGCEDLLKI